MNICVDLKVSLLVTNCRIFQKGLKFDGVTAE